jgi:hypothetical protein
MLNKDDVSLIRPYFGKFIYYTATVGRSQFIIKPSDADRSGLALDSIVDVTLGITSIFGMAREYLAAQGWTADEHLDAIKRVKLDTLLKLFGITIRDLEPLVKSQQVGKLKEYTHFALAGSTILYFNTNGVPLDAQNFVDACINLDPLPKLSEATPTPEYLIQNGFVSIAHLPPYRDGTVFVNRRMTAEKLESLFGRAGQDFYVLEYHQTFRDGPTGYVATVGNALCQIRHWRSSSRNLHKAVVYVMVFLEPLRPPERKVPPANTPTKKELEEAGLRPNDDNDYILEGTTLGFLRKRFPFKLEDIKDPSFDADFKVVTVGISEFRIKFIDNTADKPKDDSRINVTIRRRARKFSRDYVEPD